MLRRQLTPAMAQVLKLQDFNRFQLNVTSYVTPHVAAHVRQPSSHARFDPVSASAEPATSDPGRSG